MLQLASASVFTKYESLAALIEPDRLSEPVSNQLNVFVPASEAKGMGGLSGSPTWLCTNAYGAAVRVLSPPCESFHPCPFILPLTAGLGHQNATLFAYLAKLI